VDVSVGRPFGGVHPGLRAAVAEEARHWDGYVRRPARVDDVRRTPAHRARLVLTGPRPVDGPTRLPPHRAGDQADPDLLAGHHVRAGVVDARRGARRPAVRHARDGRWSANAPGARTVAGRRPRELEGAARATVARVGAGGREAIAPVSSGTAA